MKEENERRIDEMKEFKCKKCTKKYWDDIYYGNPYSLCAECYEKLQWDCMVG